MYQTKREIVNFSKSLVAHENKDSNARYFDKARIVCYNKINIIKHKVCN